MSSSSSTLAGQDTRRGEWRCMQPQKCQLCGKIFSNSGNLRQHISNVHLPGEKVPCTVCFRMFKNKEYLRKHHVQTHNAPLRRLKR
ncbi:BTB/POZ domain [Nesidiocoris tenuis]|uniref:BTB/POZ domain n=1 Tax=Nesidiocoris tenuis TaxID=355587 RepID=A0ABN7B5K4_9HEMI|nr:BTB/POZ domain [Nesidiocoris tenuis]